MEEAISKLRSIGIKEISLRTHIALNKIEGILEKDFARLDKTTAIGFVRILEREYGVDLGEWMVEFENYLSVNGKTDLNTIETHLVDVRITRGDMESEHRGRGMVYSLALLVLLAGGYYVYTNHFDEILKLLPTKEEKSIEPIISDANKSIQTARVLTGVSGEIPQIEVHTNEAISIPFSLDERQKLDVSNTLESNGSTLLAVNTELNSSTDNVSSAQSASQQVGVDANVTKEIFLRVKNKVWLGIVYLDNNKRAVETVVGQYQIDGSREQILRTGHGMLEVVVNGKVEQQYHSGSPMRFYYLPGEELKVISLEEFKAKNGGKEW
ncbi:MAG: hypothetical protein ACTTJS_08155 [Wolinella sp.]